MANVNCKCGHVFSDGQIPCPHEYNLISDEDSEELTNRVIDISHDNEDTYLGVETLFWKFGVVVYSCPKCKGLLVFWDGLEKISTYYEKVN